MTYPTPLSEAMRAGSRDAHRHAESARFVGDLVSGRSDPASYGAYLLRLRAVYGSLEHHVRRCTDEDAVREIWDPALERGAALEADLDYWCPGRGREVSTPAVEDYRRALSAAAEQPHRLVAHHYTRYLGDLAGGQVLARAVRDHLRPDPGRGLAFYDFSHLGRPVHYRDRYRARLDGLPLSQLQHQEVVAEVQHAFALNRALLDELAPPGGQAS